jgi:hypothetical protein
MSSERFQIVAPVPIRKSLPTAKPITQLSRPMPSRRSLPDPMDLEKVQVSSELSKILQKSADA